MSEGSFRACAALSLAVHIGLAVGVVAPALRHPKANPASGAGASAEHGSAALGGETFDITDEAAPLEESAEPADPEANADESATAAPIEIDDGPPAPKGSAQRHPHAARASHAASAAPAPPPPALYGAVGERGSIDLVTAFKRSIGMNGLSDPVWNSVPVGFYANADVTLTIDEAGNITHVTVSANAAPALKSAIARTMATIKGRTFTARGAQTRLRIVARVSDQITNQGRVLIDAKGAFETANGHRIAVDVTER